MTRFSKKTSKISSDTSEDAELIIARTFKLRALTGHFVPYTNIWLLAISIRFQDNAKFNISAEVINQSMTWLFATDTFVTSCSEPTLSSPVVQNRHFRHQFFRHHYLFTNFLSFILFIRLQSTPVLPVYPSRRNVLISKTFSRCAEKSTEI